MGRRSNIDLPGLVEEGEHPDGFTAQTANGTAKAGNSASGWNQQWNGNRAVPQAPRVGPWARGNRSGE